MKRASLWVLAGILSVGVVGHVHSQGAAGAKSALQQLQAIKAQNAELLNKQGVTLQQLDTLQKASAQLKIFSKRG